MQKTMMIVLVGTVAALGGCASTPIPADRLSRAQAAVKSAEDLNAAAEPAAALHLKLAKEQLSHARDLMKDGENKEAAAVLLRAEADGEVALELARARSARVEAQQTVRSIQQTMAQLQAGGQGS